MGAKRQDSSTARRARAKVVELFGADLRSLATFRIVLALLVLVDLANRLTDLSAHYSDEGVLPRSALIEGGILNKWSISLGMVNGEPFFQGLLFGLLALAALGLLAGYRTRLMTVVAWVLLLSIQFRNPLLSGAGEPLLRLLLFWGMFLPLGAVWSVDRLRGATPARPSTNFLSVATVGLFMQIAFVYWFTALQKSGEEWRVDGTALYYALSYDQVATPLGRYLLQFPEVLKVLTFGTIALEAFGPFLLFCPFFTGPVRTAAVAAFMSLHYGIWLSMDIGIFPWVSALSFVCFLPSWFWDRPFAMFRASAPAQLAALASRLQDSGARLLHACYSPVGIKASPAAGLIGHANNSGAPAAARHGGRGGAGGDREGPRNGQSRARVLRSSLAANVAAGFFLIYIFFWNLSTVSEFEVPERLEPIGYSLGVAQSWSMFAPFPTREDGWFVLPGDLSGGQRVDLMPVTRDDFALHPVSWAKPRSVSATDKNEHWRKYLQSLRQEDYAGQRLHFSRYVCREWNARHTGPERLVTFEIVYMLEMTQPDHRSIVPEKVVLWEHKC